METLLDTDGLPMKSQNFEFLRAKHPMLASLGGFAELYARTDPASALVKLRSMAEFTVDHIYVTLRLSRPYQANLNDLLNESAFRAAVPEIVQQKLHLLRKHGNEAAHGDPVAPALALARLKDVYGLASWLFATFDGGKHPDPAAYREPVAAANDGDAKVLQNPFSAPLRANRSKNLAIDRGPAQMPHA